MSLSQQIEQKKFSAENYFKYSFYQMSYILNELKIKSKFFLEISKKNFSKKEKKESLFENETDDHQTFSKKLKMKNLFLLFFFNILMGIFASLFLSGLTEYLLKYSFNFLSFFNNKVIKENILWISGFFIFV